MGLYDKEGTANAASIDFYGAAKKALPFAIGIIAIIVLLVAFNALSELLKAQPIVSSFSENPLEPAKGETFSKLTVTITNTLGENSQNTIVILSPEDRENIIVSPQQTELGLIEKGNKRITEFIVRPNPGKTVMAGTYTINIVAILNGQQFKQQTVLEIKND